MRSPFHPIPGLALAGMLTVLLFAGCGGGSHAGSTATVTSPAQAAGIAATSSPTASTPTTSPSGASAHAAGGGSQAHASNTHDGVPYHVHTISMSPTYQPGSTTYYDPTRTRPHIGDVIIFFLSTGALKGACRAAEGGVPCRYPAPGLTKTLAMKRVVGLPGDTLAIHHGRVVRNNHPEQEPPTVSCGAEAGCEFPNAFTVPAGYYYVLSDDRQLYQEDSRAFGAVSQQAVVGTVVGG